MFMMKSKQQGFTLLELLVVITLLAVLAVGALVAYEDVGDNAEAAAAANANVTLDSAIRTYRAVEKAYPNQWDSLSTLGGAKIGTLPNAASAIFGNLALNVSAAGAIETALGAVGIDEIQYMRTTTLVAGVLPNRAHNESANPDLTNGALEVDTDDFGGDFNNISIVPSGGATGTCAFESVSLATAYNGAAVPNNSILNALNDSLEGDECHLVLALGFGSDAAASTTSSKVAISQAPTYTKANVVNPTTNYARYIGLFHVAQAAEGVAGETTATALDKARLIAVITPDGKVIDDSIAAAQ